MKVYRYEHHEDRDGPYTHWWKHCGDLCAAHSDEDHPGPWKHLSEIADIGDPHPPISPAWVCGCVSKESLSSWFRGWEVLLREHGFVAREYDVPDENVVGPDPYGQVVFFPVSTANQGAL